LRAAVSSESTLFGRTYQQLIASLDTLLRAGVRAGTIRADIEAADVLQALAGALVGGRDAERVGACRAAAGPVDGRAALRSGGQRGTTVR